MSLCRVAKSMIIESILSVKNNRYTFKNQVLDFIEKETIIQKDQLGFCSPVELIEMLIKEEKLPLYGFNGDVKTLHKETQVLIKLGFCFIADQYLKLDIELYNLLKDLDTIKQYNESLLAYNKVINKHK